MVGATGDGYSATRLPSGRQDGVPFLWQSVVLATVARGASQHKIVRGIGATARQRDNVIDVVAIWEQSTAIAALSDLLQIELVDICCGMVSGRFPLVGASVADVDTISLTVGSIVFQLVGVLSGTILAGMLFTPLACLLDSTLPVCLILSLVRSTRAVYVGIVPCTGALPTSTHLLWIGVAGCGALGIAASFAIGMQAVRSHLISREILSSGRERFPADVAGFRCVHSEPPVLIIPQFVYGHKLTTSG